MFFILRKSPNVDNFPYISSWHTKYNNGIFISLFFNLNLYDISS